MGQVQGTRLLLRSWLQSQVLDPSKAFMLLHTSSHAMSPRSSQVDFYNASALLPLTDEMLIERVRGHLEKCEPGFKGEWNHMHSACGSVALL